MYSYQGYLASKLVGATLGWAGPMTSDLTYSTEKKINHVKSSYITCFRVYGMCMWSMVINVYWIKLFTILQNVPQYYQMYHLLPE